MDFLCVNLSMDKNLAVIKTISINSKNLLKDTSLERWRNSLLLLKFSILLKNILGNYLLMIAILKIWFTKSKKMKLFKLLIKKKDNVKSKHIWSPTIWSEVLFVKYVWALLTTKLISLEKVITCKLRSILMICRDIEKKWLLKCNADKKLSNNIKKLLNLLLKTTWILRAVVLMF